MAKASERLLLAADRVTFTVQKGIKIECKRGVTTSPEDAEALWLAAFEQNLKERDTYLRSPAATHTGVQALYHSSALPNALPLPSARRQNLGILPNGLIGACLTSFTEVTTSCMFFCAVL